MSGLTVGLSIFIVLSNFWTGADICDAHSIVVESSPKEGEVLSRPPREVMLRFDAKIEKSLARVRLRTGSGEEIPLPDGKDDRASGDPDRLVFPLPKLGPGKYFLRYNVLSTDGHATSGELRFTVVSGR